MTSRPPVPGGGALSAEHQLISRPLGPSDWLVVLTVTLVVGWLALVFVADPVRFVVLNPRAKTGFEVFLAISQLFGALILALTPVTDEMAWRMRWVAAGLSSLAVGSLGFGYLYPLITDASYLSVTMYGSLYVRAIGALLIGTGLVSVAAPRLRHGHALGLGATICLLGVAIALVAEDLPPLVRIDGMSSVIDHDPAVDTGAEVDHAHLLDVERVLSGANTVFPGLTVWHWSVSLVPLVATTVAAWGAWIHRRKLRIGTWLLIAVVLLAGAQLHSLFWPSMYSSILTTTSVLRIAVAAVVIAGAIHELRRLVDERAVLLTAERERVARLEELATLKADFTSIVAHELASPLVAIATMGEMLATGALTPDQGREVGGHIMGEAHLLQLLVSDVRASAVVERDDFRVDIRPTPVGSLLAAAEGFAHTLPNSHPITFALAPAVNVMADPDRVGQVIRNLLTNAIRHTPIGCPITVRASHLGDHVTFSISDLGPGIVPEDQARIFAKFGRSQATAMLQTPGRGLGLYLSRRILQAHGSDLELESCSGHGATFRFRLENAS